MEDNLFTVEEVTKYLKIPKSTIYKLSQKGQIPSSKIGKQLRFKKSSLDKWLTEKESTTLSLFTAKNKTDDQRLKQVLLIDDDDLVLKTVAKFLKSHGYNVTVSQSGEDALEEVRKLNFDLIITDIRMPGIDGIETIKRIREFHAQNNRLNIPEIIITGFMDPEAQRQAEQLGIRDYLYKPFAINDFIKAIKEKIEFGS